MHNRRNHLIGVLSTAALLSVLSAGSHAQSFPTKPVRIVVPYTAGGPVDTLARALSTKLGEIWNQPVIVDNKPGANEVIGATTVAKSDPDGHTLILATDPTLSLNPFLFKKLSYDAVKELAPITRVAVSNMAFVVPATMTANSMKDFVTYAKENPGKVSYGSSGIGNGTHLAMAAFSKDNNVEMVHIPYKGLAPTLQDMMAGNIQAAVGAVSVIAPFATNGKLKVLGISGPKRAAALPDVPTFAQAGFPKFEASFYFGLATQSGVSADIKNKIAADVKRVVSDAKFRSDYLDKFALEPILDTPAEFARYLDGHRETSKTIITSSGAQLD
ncbi:MAG: tripartite tricarboxylate transporter substrate binding protein [Pseudomonadota bacterium]|jgi:tripartite-type tricarboxylate transporter receptor subunit TctC